MANITPGPVEGGDEKVTTVIADDLEIKGTIKFESSLMTKGVIEGEIISQGLLIVGPTAKVSASIITKNLISHGEIKGDVIASEKAVLKKTAVHMGSITTPSVVIESGSVFNGACTMQRKPVEEAPRESAPAAEPEVPDEQPLEETAAATSTTVIEESMEQDIEEAAEAGTEEGDETDVEEQSPETEGTEGSWTRESEEYPSKKHGLF